VKNPALEEALVLCCSADSCCCHLLCRHSEQLLLLLLLVLWECYSSLAPSAAAVAALSSFHPLHPAAAAVHLLVLKQDASTLLLPHCSLQQHQIVQAPSSPASHARHND
jgi:hypothetical protein